MDGVQFTFHEVKHPTLSKDPDYFAHKLNGPGLGYELALSIYESKLIWIRKNKKTSDIDRETYRAKLKKKIPAGKKVVADRGYAHKELPEIAGPNSNDPPELRTFKARARMRQEQFNGRLKRFNCLTDQF